MTRRAEKPGTSPEHVSHTLSHTLPHVARVKSPNALISVVSRAGFEPATH